jgi:hypothetical protein
MVEQLGLPGIGPVMASEVPFPPPEREVDEVARACIGGGDGVGQGRNVRARWLRHRRACDVLIFAHKCRFCAVGHQPAPNPLHNRDTALTRKRETPAPNPAAGVFIRRQPITSLGCVNKLFSTNADYVTANTRIRTSRGNRVPTPTKTERPSQSCGPGATSKTGVVRK